jgi:hypothetical protein
MTEGEAAQARIWVAGQTTPPRATTTGASEDGIRLVGHVTIHAGISCQN